MKELKYMACAVGVCADPTVVTNEADLRAALHTFDGHGTCTVCGVKGEVKAVIMWLPKAPYDGKTYSAQGVELQ